MSGQDWKPSVRIRRVLMGEVRLEDEDQGIQSACSLHIYRGAVAILKMGNVEQRRAALKKLPEALKPHVEKEVIRLFDRSRKR